MLAVAGLSVEKIAIELLDAVRVARTASSVLIEHAASTAELARLEWEQESASLKKFVLAMESLAVLIGLTFLYSGLLIVAIAWDTPYRLYAMALLPLLFAIASYLVWCFLGRLSQQREERFTAFNAELGKTLQLLRSRL